MRRRSMLLLSLFLVGLLPLITGAAQRSYVTGYYGLELDGVFVGWVGSVEGGQAVGEVVTEQMGGDLLARKHIGNVKYEDITIQMGSGMSKAVYEWIKASLDGTYQRKNGAIVAADYNFKEVSRMEFHNALLTEFGMPALDAASKDAAKMTIKFKPEYTRRKPGSGKAVKAPDTKNQKAWLPSNFRLKIDGLEGPLARVNKIEALVIKQKNTDDIGDHRDYEKEPGMLEFPNLLLTAPELDAGLLYDWHEDFVINGINGQEKEKGGTLEYLAADGRTVLFTLTFHNLGIFRLAPDKAEAGNEQIRRVKAEMYCEDIRFSYSQAVFN